MSLVTDTITATSRIDESMGTSITSAASPNIASATGNTLRILGTTTITSFTAASQAGITRRLIFADALILTHSANLLLFGSANITTQAGDIAIFTAKTTTIWEMTGWFRPSSFNNGEMDASGIADGSITSVKLADACVIPSKTRAKAITGLADADGVFTEGEMLDGLFIITATASRDLTLAPALDIIASLPGYQIGTSYEFTVINTGAFPANLIDSVGLTVIGDNVINNESGTFLVRVTTPTTVEVYRK